jgi:cell division septation protein DedD
VLDLEEPGEEKTPPPRAEGPLFEQEDLFSEQDDAPSEEKPGSKKYPLTIGGGILIILLLAVLGYFFLFPSEEPPTPAGTKVPASKKEFAHRRPLASNKPVVKEQKETIETTLQEPDEEKASLQPAEPASSSSDEVVEEATHITAETPEIPITSEIPETSETPEAPETPGPPSLSPGAEEKYSIHVASFKVKENALGLKDRLQNKGYPVLCYLAPIPGKGEWYRVQVGYYASPEEAQHALSKLESEEKLAALKVNASLQPEKPIPSLSEENAEEAPPAIAATPVPTPLSPGPGRKYSIHVGSFKIKENAFDLKDRLQNKGYPVLCYLTTIPGKGEWYRVEVGYYSSQKAAQQALLKLESEEKFTALNLTAH